MYQSFFHRRYRRRLQQRYVICTLTKTASSQHTAVGLDMKGSTTVVLVALLLGRGADGFLRPLGLPAQATKSRYDDQQKKPPAAAEAAAEQQSGEKREPVTEISVVALGQNRPGA